MNKDNLEKVLIGIIKILEDRDSKDWAIRRNEEMKKMNNLAYTCRADKDREVYELDKATLRFDNEQKELSKKYDKLFNLIIKK